MVLGRAFAQCNDRMRPMHEMHIRGIDLNLALVLQTLLEERSVSRAAARLGLSQSATSHALARLRDIVKDPLFVRTSRGLTPTVRAEGMADALTTALASIERSFFAPPAFDPAHAKRTFEIGTSDYTEHLLLPPLLTRLAKVAPHMDVRTRATPNDPMTHLAHGDLDLGMWPIQTEEKTQTLHVAELWEDRFVGVVRRGHPLLKGKVTVDRYASARHAFIAPRGKAGGAVDDALALKGRSRRVALMTPSFLIGPQVVAKTDLVITLGWRIASALAETLPLALFEPPVELAGFRLAMYWHERRHDDPAHRFLREEILAIAASLPRLPNVRGRAKRSLPSRA